MTALRWPPAIPTRRSRPATRVELAILDALKTRGELSTSGVAAATGRSMGRVSTVLHRLHSAGLILRRVAADQRRENVTWTLWRLP